VHTNVRQRDSEKTSFPDPLLLAKELRMLAGGVVDTSTLIYLDRISLLGRVCSCLSLNMPLQVQDEFGHCPAGCKVVAGCNGLGADGAVVRMAQAAGNPVFSDDRLLLMAARSAGLSYYNTLMLLVALLLQEKISVSRYQKACSDLQRIAHYSDAVWAVGSEVFSLYVR